MNKSKIYNATGCDRISKTQPCNTWVLIQQRQANLRLSLWLNQSIFQFWCSIRRECWIWIELYNLKKADFIGKSILRTKYSGIYLKLFDKRVLDSCICFIWIRTLLLNAEYFFVWKWFLKEWELPLKVYCIHCSYCSINSVQLILLSIIYACNLKPIVVLRQFQRNLWRRFENYLD